MEKEVKENKMGTMPIGKLVLNVSLPMMISMLVQALYNVVDSVYVAHLSENALTAVSLAFPMQNLMIAVAAGTGVGINSLLSRSLGEKNFKRVEQTAVNGIFLALLSFVAFIFVGIFLVPVFFRSQTQVEEILEGGIQYLQICCIVSPGLFFGITFERLLQSTGRTMLTMITQSLGAIVNIILDPIMIFGYLGCPKMGVAGAAAATVIGQIVGMLLSFYFCRRKNPEVPVHFRGFRPNGEIIRGIYAVGVPSIIMQAISSVMTYGVNRILIAFSTTATAVFGVYFKLQSFVFMPVFGLNNGLVPIQAYNYGARNRERVMKTFKTGAVFALCIMGVGVLAFQLIPQVLLGFFDPSEEMLRMGVPALRIISICFLPAAFSIVASSLFQALGNGVYSMINSFARQLVVLLPVAKLLSLSGRLELVWLAFPIADVVSVTIAALCLRRIYRLKIKPLGEEPPADDPQEQDD